MGRIALSEDERKARRKASKAAYRAKNRKKLVAQQVAYRAANPEKVAAFAAAWQAANPRYNAAWKAAYRAANPEKAKAKSVKQKLRKYGLTVEQYDIMLSEQNGTCGICKLVCLTGWRLAVDHCHDTKAVRGLLCGNCNRGNGMLKESPRNLAASLRYLAKHGKALTTEEVDELTRDLHHYT